MSTWIRVLLIAWIGIAASQSASAAVCGPYKVAFYEYSARFFKDANGQYVGIDKDVVDEVGRRSGCQLEGFLDSRAKTWGHLEAGLLDMTVSALSSPQRLNFVQFSPYIRTRKVLFVRSPLGTPPISFDAFTKDDKLRLGVVRAFQHGAVFNDWVAAMKQQGRVDEYTDPESVVRAFAFGRVNAFIADPIDNNVLIQRHQLEGKVVTLEPPNQAAVLAGMAFSRKRVAEEDFQKMRLALESMRKDGTLLKIFQRYLPPDMAAQWVP